MSDRKAELERKRKRLEEIKKAREEKKKVRNLEDEMSGLTQYLTSKVDGYLILKTGSKPLWFS